MSDDESPYRTPTSEQSQASRINRRGLPLVLISVGAAAVLALPRVPVMYKHYIRPRPNREPIYLTWLVAAPLRLILYGAVVFLIVKLRHSRSARSDQPPQS